MWSPNFKTLPTMLGAIMVSTKREREREKKMTNTTMTLTEWEMKTWNEGSTWQRAYIAHRHGEMSQLTREELKELLETLEDQNFYANMSDDYSVTLKELRENTAIANEAKKLLNS